MTVRICRLVFTGLIEFALIRICGRQSPIIFEMPELVLISRDAF